MPMLEFLGSASNEFVYILCARFQILPYNPEGIMFDLLVEALILVDPPFGAVFTCVVWEHSLSGPHLRGQNFRWVTFFLEGFHVVHLYIQYSQESSLHSIVRIYV